MNDPFERTNGPGNADSTARRTLVVVGIVALALLIWQIRDALLLIFLGALLAVFFRGLARRLSDHTPLSTGWSLVIVGLTLVAFLTAGVFLLGPSISSQFSRLTESLPQSIDQVRSYLSQTGWGQAILQRFSTGGGSLRLGGSVFSRLTGIASGAASFITNLLLVIFAAIFFAADPDLYRRGLLKLVPKRRTDRVAQVLDASGQALWKWLMAKLLAMLFVGVVVTVGLSLIGVPLALALGLIAALLDFVPFVGPIVAAIPGVLLGFTSGPLDALYAALVYFVAQQIEGNVVTPLVQQHEVSLPPVLVLFAVVAAGLVFGVIGIVVATPLTVVIMVGVKMLYVEDALGKEAKLPGAD